VFFENQNVGKADKLESLSSYNTESFNNKNKLPILEFEKINLTKYRIRVHSATGEFPLVFSESFHDGWKNYLVKSSKVHKVESSLNEYKIIDGNSDDQASREELADFIQKGWVTDLGSTKEREIKHQKSNEEKQKEELDYIEKYKIDFISKNFQDTIQNDNLPKGNIFETWFKKPINDENHLMVNGYANAWIVDTSAICDKQQATSDKSFCVQNEDGSYDFEMVVEFWPQRLFYVGAFISLATLLACISYLGYDYFRRKKSKIEKTKNSNDSI